MSSSVVGSGAEAIITREPHGRILKTRITKAYRIPEIDVPLRESRTKREAKILKKAALSGVPVPTIFQISTDTLIMEEIAGVQLKYVLDDQPHLARIIGSHLATLHNAGIIHGDLTTSNMIYTPDKTLYIIDFGLSFMSERIEDKAVDIHLFLQALESKHFRVKEEAYVAFLEGYIPVQRKEILERLAIVEQRGRNKEKF